MALSSHRIVVLRALGLGDFLTAVPALRGIRRGYPGSNVTLATSPALRPLLPLVGGIDGLLPVAALGRLGRLEGVDLVVNLHGRGPESIADVLGSGARTVLSHASPHFPELPGPQWRADLHEVERWCRLVRYAGLTADPADLGLIRPGSASPAPGAIVIHPGAAAPARRWPAERFGAVARTLAGAGAPVVLTGSAAERDLADAVLASGGLPSAASLAGRLELDELAAVVAEARLVICGDTGVAHLASAFGTPSVVLFGPTPPAWWGPPESGPHLVLWRGGRGDPLSGSADPGLLQITVAEVVEAAEAMLADTDSTNRQRSGPSPSRRVALAPVGGDGWLCSPLVEESEVRDD